MTVKLTPRVFPGLYFQMPTDSRPPAVVLVISPAAGAGKAGAELLPVIPWRPALLNPAFGPIGSDYTCRGAFSMASVISEENQAARYGYSSVHVRHGVILFNLELLN